MARPSNINMTPGGGGGSMPARSVKVSPSVKVTVKPGAPGIPSKEAARLTSIYTKGYSPTPGGSKSIGSRIAGGIAGVASKFINPLYK